MSKTSNLSVGDIVLKAAGHVHKGLRFSKFTLNWETPYVIWEAYDRGYFLLLEPDSDDLLASISAKWLKLYYSQEIQIVSKENFHVALTIL